MFAFKVWLVFWCGLYSDLQTKCSFWGGAANTRCGLFSVKYGKLFLKPLLTLTGNKCVLYRELVWGISLKDIKVIG